MENTLIKILLSSNNKILIAECLKSYQYFIKYIFDKFNELEYLKSTLKMFTSFCNIKDYNEKIIIIAICYFNIL